MSVGICKSCSPVLDAVKLASNPKADLNRDGKVTTTELQNVALEKGIQTDTSQDLLKTDTGNKPDPYIASKNPSNLSGGTLLALAQIQ